MVSTIKVYFLLMLTVKQGFAMAQLHVFFISDLSVMEKCLFRSADCQSREKKRIQDTVFWLQSFCSKVSISHFHSYFISQSKSKARHDVNRAGNITLPQGEAAKAFEQ